MTAGWLPVSSPSGLCAMAQPCTLSLTGPAGGEWHAAGGGERIDLDAFEFCWTVSGRAPGAGLLATPVPF